MGNFNFQMDISEAVQHELFLIDYLKRKDGHVLIEHKIGVKFKEWDFKMKTPDGKIFTFEAKQDFGKNKKGEWTGNVFVEYSCYGKPSDISTTTADFWLWTTHTKDGIGHYAIPTETMKALVGPHLMRVPGGDIKPGWPRGVSMGYLLKQKVLAQKSMKI